jgi:predicted RNA-binding protein with RPS1 domain
VLYFGIAFWARAGTTGDFYVAGKGVHPVINGMATGADWMSAASFISMAGLIAFLGYGGSVYLMGWTGGYVLLAMLLAPYLRKFGKFTVPEFIGDRYYSQAARVVAVICLIFISFTYVAGQMRGVGIVFSRYLEVSVELGLYIGMGVVFVYAVLGGMKGITYTQVAQYVVLIFAYTVPAVFIAMQLNITDYGAFVELEPGVEGLVHVSEMSWTKKNLHPSKILSTSQEVDVQVLDVDGEKRRISLGIKQVQDNPWDAFIAENGVGSVIEGEIKNITEFGLFVGLTPELDGMVHLSDIAWDAQGEEALTRFNKGDMVKAKVLDVDVDKERISLGIKQVDSDPMADADFKRGQIITAEVVDVATGGIEVSFGEGNALRTFIRKSDLSRDRQEQRADRFSVGDRLDAMVTGFDKSSRKVSLSVKAMELADEKDAIAQFGSSDSGASLGDILGAALKDKK